MCDETGRLFDGAWTHLTPAGSGKMPFVSEAAVAFDPVHEVWLVAGGENQRWRLGSGWFVRDHLTSVRDGQSNGRVPQGTPQEAAAIRTAVINAMDGHVLGKAVLVARFHRQ